MAVQAGEIQRIAAASTFSGAVRIDIDGRTHLDAAYGLASRAYEVENTPATRFAIASGNKAFTACAIVSLIEGGTLALDTTARSLLGDDLPLVADDVTVEHLLAHRSGIGDYLDEEAGASLDDFPPPPPGLVNTEDYLPALDGHPTKFAAGERFAYCNGGYVILALLAERASGVPFADLVAQRVCEPAGMASTAFLRSDELPPGTATGYVDADGLRTNIFRVPVRGSGDGGIFTTTADMLAFWTAFFAGRIVGPAWAARMVQPSSELVEESYDYGLGFWLQTGGGMVMLEGHDVGASFRSLHDPRSGTTATVIANWSEGAWPLVRHLTATLYPVS